MDPLTAKVVSPAVKTALYTNAVYYKKTLISIKSAPEYCL